MTGATDTVRASVEMCKGDMRYRDQRARIMELAEREVRYAVGAEAAKRAVITVHDKILPGGIVDPDVLVMVAELEVAHDEG